MFIIDIEHKATLDEIDQHLEAHRKFLDDCYQKNLFLMSGPKKPRTGGIIIANMADREQLLNLLKADPFYHYKLSDYTITEFSATKTIVSHANFT